MKTISVILLKFLIIYKIIFLDDTSCTSTGQKRVNGTCLYISTTIKTWFEARAECVRMSGDLLKVNTPLEHSIFKKEFEKQLFDKYWIGLVSSLWKWTTDDQGIVTRYDDQQYIYGYKTLYIDLLCHPSIYPFISALNQSININVYKRIQYIPSILPYHFIKIHTFFSWKYVMHIIMHGNSRNR